MEKKGSSVGVQQSSRDIQTLQTSDDNPIVKRIQAIHGPENHEFDMKPLLDMIELILNLSNSAPGEYPAQSQLELLKEGNLGSMHDVLSNKINTISSEILGSSSGSQDAQETILVIFSALASFSWNAKGVIALAAFAVNYGEICLIAQLHKTNDPIAKSLALLEQLSDVLNRFESSKVKVYLAELTKELLALAKCIYDFMDLPEWFIKSNAPEIVNAGAQFPEAIYWIIRSIVICQSQITNLTGAGYEYIASNAESWEFSSLIEKVKQLSSHLSKQLELCHQCVEENRVKKLYQKITNLIDINQNDNTEILKTLIGRQEDVLFNGITKRTASADSLRKKTVLLYISGLDLPKAELSVLKKIYSSSQIQKRASVGQYDVVWIPVLDKSWNVAEQNLFETTREGMPWYSLWQPWLLDDAVIEYIKNVWHFQKASILVTLSQKGNIAHYNAMHIMLIWGNLAYPFTSSREEQLWTAETWRLQLLVDGIEPSIDEWIQEGKYICLYGGEDIRWIRQFTAIAASVTKSAQIPLEMVYMGTSDPKEKVAENNATIAAEKLSHVIEDLDQIWLFWFRLKSMWRSRVQQGKSSETDRIIQEIIVMHSFDYSGRGWAIISREPTHEMSKAMGDTMLDCLSMFDLWKKNVAEKEFVAALNEQIQQINNWKGCNRFVWPGSDKIPENMVCFECGRLMMKSITFSCCGEH